MHFSAVCKPLLLVLCVAFASTGCSHVSSQIPGVLDLRSDGSEAATITEALPASDATRDGVGGFFLGTGATGSSEVVVENRAHFLGLYIAFLIHPLNGDVEDEWKAVLGKDGAARNVSIGEKLSIMGWANEMLRGLCCLPVFVFMPLSVDMTGEATRIKGGGSSARDESTTPAFPPAGSAPTDGKF
ncbi:MAG: hypothetical protein Q8O67_24730 [Deltaproteobacteria bacterium]|nr:hypothetical protein [Deltaproteobacteria bacterium]